MKILELRFKNLNSLYGEWLIDFCAAEYTANGIFALTGPTGAGKSTILDAICLALYGATPRLGKITKSSNEIMSRQSGECYAEVLFESREGRFRSHFSQHRARKKAKGELQNPRHEIAEGSGEGRIIEHQLRRVATVIEEKTGMDFERFTRSILLAQGGFDTFLKAGVEEKSKILEQITGTEIYTKISRRVHERRREEEEKLKLLQAEIAGITVLDPEQEKAIKRQLQEKQQLESTISKQVDELKKGISWLSTMDELQRDINRLNQENLKLQDDIKTFSPKRDTLEQARRAAALDAPFATLTSLRKQQATDLTDLQTREKTLPELESSVKTAAKSLKLMEQRGIQAKEQLKTATPLLRKVRALDQQLREQKRSLSALEKSCRKTADQMKADKQSRTKELKRERATADRLRLNDEYLKKHGRDEWLTSGLAGIEAQLDNLVDGQKEISRREKALKKTAVLLKEAEKKLDSSRQQRSVCGQEIETIAKKQQLGKKQLNKLLGGRLLREYRTEKESLFREMAYLKKIEELEEHRAKLEDGSPCPLCGAEEHPFAAGNIPPVDKTERKIEALTELIDKAENLEAGDKKLEKIKAAARKKLTDSEKLEASAASTKQSAEKSLTELKDSLKKLRKGLHDLQRQISTKLQPLGITEIPSTQVSSLLDLLRKRLDNWQSHVREKTEGEKEITAVQGELKRLNGIISTQKSILTEKQEQLQTLNRDYAAGKEKRKELFGEKDPDDEVKRLEKTITEAEDEEKNLRRKHSTLQQQLTAARTDITSLKTRTSRRKEELKETEGDFQTTLQTAGFPDEAVFLEASLPPPQRDILSTREKELNDRQTALKARLQDSNKKLREETEKKITDKSLEELQLHFTEYGNSLQELRETIAGFKLKLQENAVAGERIRTRRKSIEKQNNEYRRWEKLHALIGSADGKKYRNFAQGLTFELMVSHANRQLAKMTDRYLLIRDTRQPLELNVIDSYQAGEIRSSRNLSGGESFIISLTLALGLSKMASRKVRVDSLFLDEGFGSLDEEALDTALETLSGLQQNGKLIGIISHVPALKERISTRIHVSPLSGGKSTITGPGCRLV
ncbi:MAG: chromosome segregation protein SMC [Desulfocapsa sp.]|nr:MAG: chromosome segregation protein SMC [Desulfocapsa sp.]